MATIKTTAKKSAKPSLLRSRRSTPTTSLVSVSLPDQPTEPDTRFERYSILVHGEKKIGKTTLFAQEPGAFFLEWDPSQRALALLQEHVPDWRHFIAYVGLLEKENAKKKPKYKTIVIDGVDLMYQACFRAMCSKMAIEHPNDENDYGKSWNVIKTEFSGAIHRLQNLDKMAVRYLCHSAWRELKQRDGSKIERLVPLLPGQAEEVLVGLVDIWAAYAYDGEERVLVVKGDETTGAGHRVDHRFKTTDGRFVKEISMGKDAAEAYANLLSAFRNEQEYATIAERRKKVAGNLGTKRTIKLKRS